MKAVAGIQRIVPEVVVAAAAAAKRQVGERLLDAWNEVAVGSV